MHSIHPRTLGKIQKAAQKEITIKPLDVPAKFEDFAALCRIRSGNKILKFELYDYQIQLAELLDSHPSIIVFKSRQMGITEVIACKFLHKAALNPGYAAAVLSIGQQETSNVCKRIRNMPSQIPNVRFETNSLTTLEIERGGRLMFRPSTRKSLRSLESISDILYDEAAFVSEIEEIYAGAAPAQEMVGSDARTAIVSTMSEEGKLSWFWQIFEAGNGNIDADERIARIKEGRGESFDYWVDENGWCKVLVHWKAHPIYSSIPNYLEKTKKEKKLPESKLQREYNLGIPEGGGSLFTASFVDACAVGQWRPPQPKRCYLAGIDPNFGGNDFYVCQIWDVTTTPYSLVAHYRDSQRSNEYNEQKTLELIDSYLPGVVAIEKNSGGAIILEQLRKKRPRLRVEPVTTSRTSKIVHTDRLALATEFRQVVYPKDWIGIQEMKRFSLATREASTGNDDSIMAWAAAWVWLEDAIAECSRSSALKSLFN